MRQQVCFLLLLALPTGPVIGAETGGRVRVQLGYEYDTNARREASPPLDSGDPVAGDLARLVLEGLLHYSTEKHHLMADYLGGFKLFPKQASENLVATKLMATYQYTASKNWWLGSRMTLRDTWLEVHDRDYRLLQAELFERNRILPRLELEVFLGGRYFLFKPDDYLRYSLKLSHAGPVAGVRLYLAGGDGVTATAQYQAELRFFEQEAQSFQNGIRVKSGQGRLDLYHVGGLLVRQSIHYWKDRRLVLELSYFLSLNDSNNGGSSALWHRLRLVLSMQLPLEITLHLMGTLQFTDYPYGIYFEGDWYEPEADENENSLVVRIGYPLGKGLSVFIQGGIYRNEFHSEEDEVRPFERETLMLGVAYHLPF